MAAGCSVGVGQLLLKIHQFNESQVTGLQRWGNNLNFWRSFVGEYFDESALWECYVWKSQKKDQEDRKEGKIQQWDWQQQEVVDVEIQEGCMEGLTGEKKDEKKEEDISGKKDRKRVRKCVIYQLSRETLPRFFYTIYSSRIFSMFHSVEHPREFRIIEKLGSTSVAPGPLNVPGLAAPTSPRLNSPHGQRTTYLLFSSRTRVFYKYDNGSVVVTNGYLRVTFTENLKILQWEFESRKARHLLPRSNQNLIIKLPKPVHSHGLPSSIIRFFKISNAVNQLTYLIDHCSETYQSPILLKQKLRVATTEEQTEQLMNTHLGSTAEPTSFKQYIANFSSSSMSSYSSSSNESFSCDKEKAPAGITTTTIAPITIDEEDNLGLSEGGNNERNSVGAFSTTTEDKLSEGGTNERNSLEAFSTSTSNFPLSSAGEAGEVEVGGGAGGGAGGGGEEGAYTPVFTFNLESIEIDSTEGIPLFVPIPPLPPDSTAPERVLVPSLSLLNSDKANEEDSLPETLADYVEENETKEVSVTPTLRTSPPPTTPTSNTNPTPTTTPTTNTPTTTPTTTTKPQRKGGRGRRKGTLPEKEWMNVNPKSGTVEGLFYIGNNLNKDETLNIINFDYNSLKSKSPKSRKKKTKSKEEEKSGNKK